MLFVNVKCFEAESYSCCLDTKTISVAPPTLLIGSREIFPQLSRNFSTVLRILFSLSCCLLRISRTFQVLSSSLLRVLQSEMDTRKKSVDEKLLMNFNWSLLPLRWNSNLFMAQLLYHMKRPP